MALIAQPIPPQSFEIIRDRIAEIIADELAQQVVLDYGVSEIDADVVCEQWIPSQDNDQPLINVCVARGDYDNMKPMVLDGTYLFNVDAYTYALGTDSEKGDSIAAKRLHRLLGLCRAIIMDPIYKTLGFGTSVPFIQRVSVNELGIADPNKMDMNNCIMGRLVVAVKCTELQAGKIPVLEAGHTTQITFLNSNAGYKYE